MLSSEATSFCCPAVVPVLAAPLWAILTVLPGILLATFGGMVRLFSPTGFHNAVRLLWQQKITVTLLVLAGVGVVYAYRTFVPRSSTSFAGGHTEKGSDWPCTRGNLLHTGSIPDSPSPTVFKVVWNYRNPEGFGFVSSPAVVGNRVYISGWLIGHGDRRGHIFCLDADTGAVIWANSPEGYRPTFSSPVVAGDYLVCGEGVHDTKDARIVCLNAHDGNVLWTYATQNHVECTPVIDNGRVYVGAGDDGIYCLDLKPQADGKARVIWHLTSDRDDVTDCETSLAVHDGKVYLGLGIPPEKTPDKAKAMCVIDADTGKEFKRLPMGYPVFSPATIDVDNKQIYFGMGNGTYPELEKKGAIQCLNLDTLTSAWRYELPMTVLGSVAVIDNLLYFGCGDGVLYCLTKDGQLSDRFDTHSVLKTSPAVTARAVYLVTDNGMLIALDRRTLERMWEYRLGPDQNFFSSPVVARGHVYVGTEKNGFFCLGDALLPPYWPNPLGGLSRTGNADDAPLPKTETLRTVWAYPFQADRQEKVRCAAAVAVWKDDLYVPIAGKKTGLACLPKNAEANDLKPHWFVQTPGEISQAPVVLSEFVLATTKPAGPNGQAALHCLRRETGKSAWTLPLEMDGMLTVLPQQFDPREPTTPRLQILIQDRADRLTSLDGDGKVVWSQKVGSLGKDPADRFSVRLYPTCASNILVVASRAPALVALDRGTGTVLWSVPLSGPPLTSPWVSRNVIYLGTESGIEARSLLDGKLTGWKCEAGPPSAEFCIAEQWVFYVNRAGEMIVASRADGSLVTTNPNGTKKMGRVGGAVPGYPPLPFNDHAVVVTEKGLSEAMFSAGNDLQLFLWKETNGLGRPAAPLVLCNVKSAQSDGAAMPRLFVPTLDRGLVCIEEKE